MCAHARTRVLSRVWLSVIPWTVARQAPLSVEFSRQEYWSGLPFPFLGDFPNPGIEPSSPGSPVLASRFFTTEEAPRTYTFLPEDNKSNNSSSVRGLVLPMFPHSNFSLILLHYFCNSSILIIQLGKNENCAKNFSFHFSLIYFQYEVYYQKKNICVGYKAYNNTAAAAAKSLQSCLTLCDPRDSSPLGSSVPGILQARTLEWVAISFSNAWKWKVKVKSLSRSQLLVIPWTAAYQAPPSIGFSRQDYWSGVPLPSPTTTLNIPNIQLKNSYITNTV